ncbi:MAG: EamA family transporter, partial [Spirochaetaceae bacterium]|nr:EamA family transporter [Spirochaetaceae bacterium]
VQRFKGKIPRNNQKQRMKALSKIPHIDSVLPADEPVGSWEILLSERPDIICIGHDQMAMLENYQEWIIKQNDLFHPEIVILSPYRRHHFSSSRISKRKQTIFKLLIVMAMLLWGFSWVSGKWAAGLAPPLYLLFWRFLICTLIFLPATLMEKPLKKEQKKYFIPWTSFSALMLTSYNYLFFKGLSAALAGKSGVIVTTFLPLFTLVLGIIFLKKRLVKMESLGFVLGIIGGILLIAPWEFTTSQFMQSTNLLFFGAAFLWSLLTLFSRMAQQKIPMFRFNFFLYLQSTILAFILSFIEGINPLNGDYLSWPIWLNILYLAIFASAIASGIYFRASLELGPAKASSFAFVVPLSALGFGAILQSENPSKITLIGASLSILALIIINTKPKKRKQKL